MGYLRCQHCGSHFRDDKVVDFYQWNKDDSIGWSYICPVCGEENYKEIKF